MRCTACGEELKGGRCPFCGHEYTKAELAADAAWARQKAGMGEGPAGADWKAERPVVPEFLKKRSGLSTRKPKAPAQAANHARAAQPVQAAPARHPKAQEVAPAKPKAKHRAKKRSGRMPFWARIVVLLWILFCIWSFLQVLAGEAGIDPFHLFGI